MNELKRLQKIAGLLKENQYDNNAWDIANKLAQEKFGEFGFASLSEDQMAQIVNIQKANRLAGDYYGEFGIATLSEDQMEAIFEKHPDILNTDIKEDTSAYTNATNNELAAYLVRLNNDLNAEKDPKKIELIKKDIEEVKAELAKHKVDNHFKKQ